MLYNFPLSYWTLITLRERTHLSYAFHFSKALPRPGYKTACLQHLCQIDRMKLESRKFHTGGGLNNNVRFLLQQQLLEVITLASIWRLFGSFFHFLANGIRGSAADNRLWHGDLNPGSPQKPWHSRSTDIDQHREGGGSEIESQTTQNCKNTKLLILFLGKDSCSIQPRKRNICRVFLRKMYTVVLLPY